MQGNDSYYNQWYARNKDQVLERRRARYRASAKLREREKARVREYRKSRAVAVGPKRFSKRATAWSLGIGYGTFCKWVVQGVIPKPTVQQGSRLVYTEQQVHLLRPLVAFRVVFQYELAGDQELRAEEKRLRQEVLDKWNEE